MSTAIALRDDFDADSLRGLAKVSKEVRQARRLLALALIYDGDSRSKAARISGVTLQIVRDWVLRFNAQSPDGLKGRKSSGRPSTLSEDTISRELMKLGFVKLTARPRHAAQDPAELEDFKKVFPRKSPGSKRR